MGLPGQAPGQLRSTAKGKSTDPENGERRLTMEVEFTARLVKISKALRTHAEEGMERIGRILGRALMPASRSACKDICRS